MKTHKDLNVWKLCLELAADVYQFSKKLPKEEQFGLVSQLRRAAVSIPANIAEGAARFSTRDFIRFLHISTGSLSELETLLLLVEKIFKEDITELQAKVIIAMSMLTRLTASLRKKL